MGSDVWIRWGAGALLMWACVGCVKDTATLARGADASQETPVVTLLPPGNRPEYRFRGLDGRDVSSDASMGRVSLLAFLATFDLASQAQARFLAGIERHHRPTTKCSAVVIEQVENGPLVAAFVETLGLGYPVAHVTPEALAMTSLGSRTVPTVLAFDTGGNLVWESEGLATEEAIEQVLRVVERDSQTVGK